MDAASIADQEAGSERHGGAPDAARRDALLAEYAEVAANFRLLTDIRFKLLAFLPVAAGAATALLASGGGRGAPAEAQTLALSSFGLAVTVALATYNARNDQLYDTLVGRAASVERELGLTSGAFANRPGSWLRLRVPWDWKVNHRLAVATIYASSTGLWLFSVWAAIWQLAWGQDSAPRGALAAGVVPAVALPALAMWEIGRQRERREDEMRESARQAVGWVVVHGRGDDEHFVRLCADLGRVKVSDARARARFYAGLGDHPLNMDEEARYLPPGPASLRAAQYVALICDLPAEWLDDCYRERRVAADD